MTATEALLDALPVGLVAFCAERRLVLANAAFWRDVGAAPGTCPPGTPEPEVLRLLAECGVYGAGDPARLVEAALALDRRQPQRRRVQHRGSGRVYELTSDPLPGGGWLGMAWDVSELVRSEDAALARAELLETVLNRLKGGIVVYDADRRLRLQNPAYGALIGAGPGGFPHGITHAEVIRSLAARGEFANAEPVALVAEQLARDRTRPSSRQRTRPNGQVVRFDSQPMPDGGFLVEVDDVTALARAEADARHRATLLDGVLAALPHGICVYGADRRVTMVNAAYERIMAGNGVAVGDRLDDVIARRVATGEYDAAEAEAILAIQGVGDDVAPRRRIRPNGTAVDRRVARLPDGGHVAVLTDVTPLHEAEQDARRRAAMLEAMLGAIRHGIALFGPDRRLLACNDVTASLLNAAPGELAPGRALADILEDQVRRGDISADWRDQVLARDWAAAGHHTRELPGGRVLDVLSDPLPDGGVVFSYTDVTEERRMREAAEAASRAKSRFLATMSHELRTPLNAVIGFAEVIGAERDPARVADYAGAIHEAGRHLLSLIDDILDVARSQTAALDMAIAPVPLAPLLADAAAEAEARGRAKGVEVRSRLAEALPPLPADARRLRQILAKLLSNAVKFTPPGGRVLLSAGIEADGALAIRVADTGIGVAPADRERVFEPFTQLDASLARRYPGSGLGLYLSRSLAEALGGTLRLEEPDGPGTLAVLRFPPARGPHA